MLYTRQENGPKDPYKAAMNHTVGQLDDLFSDGPDDDGDLPGGPVTESGKDESEPVTPPTSSRTSAS